MQSSVWQDPAWVYNGQVPILGFSHDYVRDSLARVRPYPAIMAEDPDAPPMPLTKETAPKGLDWEMCDEILQRLAPFPEYMGQTAHKIDIAGEAYVALIKDDDSPSGERCQVLSSREIISGSTEQWRVRDTPDDAYGYALPPGTPFWRLWTPDPEFSILPFSHMVRLNMACEQLLLLNRLVSAVAKSRLATTGKLIAIAEEFELEQATGDGQAATEDAGDGEVLGSNFFDDFVEAGATAMMDPESAAAVMNLIVRGPHALIKDGINVIDITRTMEDVLLKLRQECREEIATGVNLPREIPLGVGHTNHWNAEEIRTQAWQIHLEPRALAVCAGTTSAFFRPSLLANKVDPDIVRRVLLWYDPKWFLGAPDLSEHADEALTHYAISLDAYRTARGWSPDDAPTDDEIKMRLGWQQQGQVKTTIREDGGAGQEVAIDAPQEHGGGQGAVPTPHPTDASAPNGGNNPNAGQGASPQDKAAPIPPSGQQQAPKSKTGKKKAIVAAGGPVEADDPPTGVMVALMIPPDEAQQLASLLDDDPNEMHVTLAYLGNVDEISDEQMIDLQQIVEQVALGQIPMDGVTTPEVYEFGQDERAVVVKPYIPGVYQLHAQIIAACEQALLPVRTNFVRDQYKPHITLGYLDPEDQFPAKLFVPTIPMHFSGLTLRAGADEVCMPFTGLTGPRVGQQGYNTPLIAAAGPSKARRKALAELGHRHVAIERDLRTRLLQLADSAVGRTLEKAGMRVKSKAAGARGTKAAAGMSRSAFAAMFADCQPREIPSLLGADAVRALGLQDTQLLDGSLTELQGRFQLLVKRAQHAAAMAAAQAAGQDDYNPDALDEEMQPHRDAGWAIMAAGLSSLALGLLYNPHPSAPEVGEFDDSALVPPGLVRAALDRAGGAREGDTRTIRGAEVPQPTSPSTAEDAVPVGGATAGPEMQATFEDQLGISQDGMTWIYGDAPRSKEFQPHKDLDGQTFTGWDDPILTNTGDWPDYDHYFCGDHNGCECDAALSYTQADEQTTLEPGLGVDRPDVFPTRTQQSDGGDSPRRGRTEGLAHDVAFGEFTEELHPRDHGKFATKEGDTTDHTAGGTLPPPSDPTARGSAMVRLMREQVKAGNETIALHDHYGGSQDVVWTPERQALHDQIVDKMLADQIKGGALRDGNMIILAGLPGAGKTESLSGGRESAGLVDGQSFVHVEADAMKAALADAHAIEPPPGVGRLECAPLLHEESSAMAQQLANQAMAQGYNVVWDITGSSEKSVQARIDAGRAAGYHITGLMVDTTIPIAQERAASRYARGLGRDVNEARLTPPENISSMADPTGRFDSQNRAIFEQTKGQYDQWAMTNNRGAVPVVSGLSSRSILGADGKIIFPHDAAAQTMPMAASGGSKKKGR